MNFYWWRREWENRLRMLWQDLCNVGNLIVGRCPECGHVETVLWFVIGYCIECLPF